MGRRKGGAGSIKHSVRSLRKLLREFLGTLHGRILSASVILVAVPLIIVGVLSSSVTSQMLTTKISETNLQAIVSARENMDLILKEAAASVDAVLQADKTAELIGQIRSDEDVLEKYTANKHMDKLVYQLKLSRSDLVFFVLSSDSYTYSDSFTGGWAPYAQEFPGEVRERLKAALIESGGQLWMEDTELPPPAANQQSCVYYARLVDNRDPDAGILVAAFDLNGLFLQMSGEHLKDYKGAIVLSGDAGILHVIGGEPETLRDSAWLTYSPRADEKADRTRELSFSNSRYIASESPSRISPFWLVGIVSTDVFLKNVGYLNIVINLIILVCLMASVVLAFLLSDIIITPLKNLLSRAKSLDLLRGGAEEIPAKLDASRRRWAALLFGTGAFQSQLLRYFLITGILPLLSLTVSTYLITIGIAEREVSAYLQQSAHFAAQRLEIKIDSLLQTSNYLLSSDIIQNALADYNTTRDELRADDVRGFVMDEIKRRGGIAYISLYDVAGRVFYCSSDILYRTGGISDQPWFSDFSIRPSGYVVTDMYQNELSERVLSLARRQYYTQYDTKTGSFLGYQVITLKESWLRDTYNIIGFMFDSRISLVNSQNAVLSSGEQEQVGASLDARVSSKLGTEETFFVSLNGKRYSVVSAPVQPLDWRVVGLVPVSDFTSWINNLLSVELYILLFCAFAVAVSSWRLSFWLSEPVVGLAREMESLRKGDWNAGRLAERRELENLTETFNSMLQRINELVGEVYETKINRQRAELRQKEAEMNALQAQINPHFLYNTLETVNWIAISLLGRENDISKTVTALSDILRSSIDKRAFAVTIDKQLIDMEKYLFIQKLRMGDRVDVRFDIDEESRKCYLPRLLLQPLVENALLHGLRDVEEGGVLLIRSRFDGGFVELSVTDNGAGMSGQELERLRRSIEEQPERISGKIGLANTNQRIKNCFGESYGLRIESGSGGTTVIIHAPAVFIQDEIMKNVGGDGNV